MEMERTRGQSALGWKGPEVKVHVEGPEVKVLGIERTRGQSSGDRKDQRSKCVCREEPRIR
jgi:hypothetical protein